MNTYSSKSPNPYAKRYLTKGRKSLGTNNNNSLNNSGYLERWPGNTKRLKMENSIAQNLKTETYSFMNDEDVDYIQEFYDPNSIEFDRIQVESCSSVENNYIYDGSHGVADENSAGGMFMDGGGGGQLEEYSIDFIDESLDPNTLIDCSSNINQYYYTQDQTQFNPSRCFLTDVSQSPEFLGCYQPIITKASSSKRKQGIVGRPTLSSPQRLLVPDNVYSRGNPVPNLLECSDSYNRNRNQYQISLGNRKKPVNKISSNAVTNIHDQETCHDPDGSRGSGARSRPRILSKPSIPEQRGISMYSHNSGAFLRTREQDALETAQRTVANREFARNLVKRAERQGTVIDKNKIPLSVFEQQPVEMLVQSALLDGQHHLSSEIREAEHVAICAPFTANVTKVPTVIVKKSNVVSSPSIISVSPKPPQMTASDILKQKWKAASRQQS